MSCVVDEEGLKMADGLCKCPKCQAINQTNRKTCYKCGMSLENAPEYDPEENIKATVSSKTGSE